MAKGLKLKVRKFWGLIPTFVEVTKEKLVGRPFWTLPPSWIGLSRVNFILMFFQELPSLLSVGKPFPGDLENWNVKKISKLMFGQNIFPYFDPCIYFSKKNPRFFRLVTLLLENKLLPLQILQNCVTPFVGGNYNIRNQGQWKFQHWRYFHMFFL